MRARIVQIFALLFLLLIPACGPRSALVNLWVDRTYPDEPLENVMVVALWRDAGTREIWEERFAEALEKNNADAIPSYVALSSPATDSTAVFRKAQRENCQGVIVIHAHVLDRNTFYVPGLTMPRYEKHPRWYRGGPQQPHTDELPAWPPVRYDVELWSPQSAQMIWSGTAEVADAGDDQHAAASVANTVVLELWHLGLVAPEL